MKYKLFIAALLLGLVYPAAAEFTTVSRAYEVELSRFTAPATLNGGAVFKLCDDCATKTVRVNENTQYVVNGQAMPLDKFKQAASKVRDRTAVTVVVLHHLKSDTVVSVSATIRN